MDKKEFIKALNHIIEEKGISKDVVFDGLEAALATAYKKNFGSKTNVLVKMDRETGDIKVYSYYVVVDDYDDGIDTVDTVNRLDTSRAKLVFSLWSLGSA